jgi:hypothetical protein
MFKRRVTSWIWFTEDRFPDWLLDSRAYDRVRGWLARLECAMHGHKAVRDQCGIPDHDFCVFCQKSMPGAAEKGAA